MVDPTGDPTGLAKILNSEVAKRAYTDVASPAGVELGQFAGDIAKCARLLLFPIQLLGRWQDRYARHLRCIADAVPPERQVAAPPSIAGPALQGLYFLEDGNPLQEMFLNLLRRCIDKERQGEAHPAFVAIIEQLSPDEALLLWYMKGHDVTFWYADSIGAMAPEDVEPGAYPLFPTVVRHTVPIDLLAFPDRMAMYHTHLKILHLLEDDEYAYDRSVPRGTDGKVLVKFRSIPTDFGSLFFKACVPEGLPPSRST